MDTDSLTARDKVQADQHAIAAYAAAKQKEDEDFKRLLEELSKPPFDGVEQRRGFGADGGHAGIDYGLANGTPISSIRSGTVSQVQTAAGGYGTYIVVDHGGGMSSLYAHLSGVNVGVGDKVGQGQQVGLSGGARGAPGAGNSSGPHLHFEILQNGKAINPNQYLQESAPIYQIQELGWVPPVGLQDLVESKRAQEAIEKAIAGDKRNLEAAIRAAGGDPSPPPQAGGFTSEEEAQEATNRYFDKIAEKAAPSNPAIKAGTEQANFGVAGGVPSVFPKNYGPVDTAKPAWAPSDPNVKYAYEQANLGAAGGFPSYYSGPPQPKGGYDGPPSPQEINVAARAAAPPDPTDVKAINLPSNFEQYLKDMAFNEAADKAGWNQQQRDDFKRLVNQNAARAAAPPDPTDVKALNLPSNFDQFLKDAAFNEATKHWSAEDRANFNRMAQQSAARAAAPPDPTDVKALNLPSNFDQFLKDAALKEAADKAGWGQKEWNDFNRMAQQSAARAAAPPQPTLSQKELNNIANYVKAVERAEFEQALKDPATKAFFDDLARQDAQRKNDALMSMGAGYNAAKTELPPGFGDWVNSLTAANNVAAHFESGNFGFMGF